MKNLKSTLLHTLELALVFIFAYIFMRWLNLDSESTQLVLTMLFGALVKYSRASDKIPLDDYVNRQ